MINERKSEQLSISLTSHTVTVVLLGARLITIKNNYTKLQGRTTWSVTQLKIDINKRFPTKINISPRQQ